MKHTRIGLLKSNFNNNKYEITKDNLEKLVHGIEDRYKNCIEFVTAYIQVSNTNYQYYLTICTYKNNTFIGIYDDTKQRITFNDTDKLNVLYLKNIERLEKRFEKACIYQTELQNPVKEAWLKTQPLLDKIIEVKEQHKIYKENKNQYKEENITNKGYFKNIDYAIDKYVAIYECLQELLCYYQKNNIPIKSTHMDFEKETVLINNIEIFDTENNKFLIHVNEKDPAIKNIHDIVLNHKNNILSDIDKKIEELIQQNHIVKKNFLPDNVVEIEIDKKEKLVYRENNIDSICEFINQIDNIIQKEQKSIEIQNVQENEEHNIEMT